MKEDLTIHIDIFNKIIQNIPLIICEIKAYSIIHIDIFKKNFITFISVIN